MSTPLKLALIGYGKMGQLIEQLAIEKGHNVVAKVHSKSTDADWESVKNADVAIEFTQPEAAVNNIKKCFSLHIPVVVGTTGWYQHLDEIKHLQSASQSALLTASNFSIGVNVFFKINQLLAHIMDPINGYDVSLQEIHHIHKKDAPSGTAITLAEGILKSYSKKQQWKLKEASNSEHDLPIEALRIDNVPGTHAITYSSAIDSIEIKHTAHNREGFALGAVIAAEWLAGKQGVFTMKDVLNFK